MPKVKPTPEQAAALATELNSRVKRKQRDFTARNCIEFVLSVYLVGVLPLSMHFLISLVARPLDWYWVPAEGWLFIMVICAAAFGDAYRGRRQDDGTLTLIAVLFGGFGAIIGALGYAFLMLRPANASALVGAVTGAVWWTSGAVAGVYLAYRYPSLQQSASEEAERTVGIQAKGG